MENSLATQSAAGIIESVVINGDLSKLSAGERVNYYRAVCESTGLNPLTKPFDYITLNGKLTLYARKDATDQLRNKNSVSIVKLERERMDGVYVVTVYAQDTTGRMDSSIGVTNIENLKGDAMANAMMKAETKAKRRVTLSICGLGMLDETEIETIPASVVMMVDDNAPETPKSNGKMQRPLAPESLAEALREKSAGYTRAGKTVNQAQRGLVAGVLNSIFQDDAKRHTFTLYACGAASLSDVPDAMIAALLDWLKPTQDSGGAYQADAMAAREAQAAYTEALKAEGQAELPI